MNFHSKTPLLILIFLILFYALNNTLWLTKDSRLFGMDNIYNLINAMEYNIDFRKGIDETSGVSSKIRKIGVINREFNFFRNNPPKFYFVSSLLNLNGFSLFRTRLALNMFYYVLLLISLFFFGKKLFDCNTALTASFIMSFYPVVYIYSRNFRSDFALLSMTSLCFALWAYMEHFNRLRYSLLFGLSSGLTFITGQIGVVYLLPLVLVSVVRVLFDKNKKTSRLINIASAISVFYLIYLVLWPGDFINKLLIPWSLFFERVASIPGWIMSGITDYLPSQSRYDYFFGRLFYNPFHLAGFMGFPLALLFLFSLIFYIKNKGNNYRIVIFNMIFFYVYALLASDRVRSRESILPFLIYSSLVTGWFITNIKDIKFRRALLYITGSYSIVFYLLVSWVLPKYSREFYWPLPSKYYLNASYEPFKEREGYVSIFSVSWPLDFPAVPDNTLDRVKRTEVFSMIEAALKKGENVEIFFPITILMHEWGHTDLWYNVAAYYFFQEYIYKGILKINHIRENDWTEEHFIRVFIGGEEVSELRLPDGPDEI